MASFGRRAVDESADYRGVPGDWRPDGTVAAEWQARGQWRCRDAGRVARAYEDKVVVDDRKWEIRGVTWLAWAGERLLAAQGGKAIEFWPRKAPRELAWKDYSGGPFSVQRGRQRSRYGVGGTRHQVWVMEHVFPALDNKH